MTCKNGKVISIFGEFCTENEECPIATGSITVLKSNCSKSQNNHCPLNKDSSKICMDKVNVPISNFCSVNVGGYWKCPNAKSGLNFDQCYERQVTCLYFKTYLI